MNTASMNAAPTSTAPMKRSAVLLSLALSLFSARAYAGDPYYVEERDIELVGFSRFEWAWVWLNAQTDWIQLRNPHPGFGVSFEALVNADEQRQVRVGVIGGFTSGFWGDADHGSPTGHVGLSLRMTPSVLMDQLLDGYFVTRPAYLNDGEHHGLRFSTGLGIRIGRAIATEVTYEPVFGLDAPFVEKPDVQKRAAHGLGLMVGVNVCMLAGICDPTRDHPGHIVDCDRHFYMLADALAAEPMPPRMCDAVLQALDTRDHPGDPSADPMMVYLAQLSALLERWGVDAAIVDELSEEHERLTEKREDARREARSYLREDKQVKRSVSYAPTPSELAARLGCNGPKPKPVKCDEAGPYQCSLVTIDPDRARPAPHEGAPHPATAR